MERSKREGELQLVKYMKVAEGTRGGGGNREGGGNRNRKLLTIVDPGHGRHPEFGVVLVIESVAIAIHGVVEVRVIPLGERERERESMQGQREVS